MSPFIETIRLEDGTLKNLSYHQSRFERTRSGELGLESHPVLSKVIQIYEGMDRGLLKCRVTYGKEIERIEFEPYIRHPATSLQVVHSDNIFYGYKFRDRGELESLHKQKGKCDDILIVQKGFVTDSFFANVAFWDGHAWFTPDTPLLPGTMRAYLMDKGILKARTISLNDLNVFRYIRLINAMNNLDESVDIPVESVVY